MLTAPQREAPQEIETPKRAYRYKVTATGGEGVKAVGESPFVLDWKHLGKEYTWNIVGGPESSFESRGFITGRFVDKGYVVDGKYETDAEFKARARGEAQ